MLKLVGQQFGRLAVVSRAGKDRWGSYMWLCMCECGTETTVLGYDLKKNKTKSCGCLRSEGNNVTHGHTKNGKCSKAYHAWSGMIQRCTNINNTEYKNYGNRGIRVCKRWSKFVNFLADMGDPQTNKYSLDRIDNNKGYNKLNCRWATHKQQARNKQNNRLITLDNKTQCLSAWAEEVGIAQSLIWKRLSRGWSSKRALLTPNQNIDCLLTTREENHGS